MQTAAKAPISEQFISFEGTEGVGKSTLIANVAAHLTAQGIDFIQTREPGGSPFAEQLRAMLLTQQRPWQRTVNSYWCFAARADHVAQVILPALAQGKWVLCDRFTDSTIAYQGLGANRATGQNLAKLNYWFISLWQNARYDHLARFTRHRRDEPCQKSRQTRPLWAKSASVFERVHQGFAYQAAQQPQRVKRIDAQGTADEVLAKC